MPPLPPVHSLGRDRFVLFTLWTLNFALSAQFLLIAPLIPRISEQLHVSQAALGSLVTIYAAAMASSALVAGPISDYVGRRRILWIGSAGMTITLLLHGFAGSFVTLLAARALAGTFAGFLTGSTIAYVGDYFPYEHRGWANGWVASAVAAGQILGVPIGAAMAMRSFQEPFLWIASASGLGFALTTLVLPQPHVSLLRTLSLRSTLTTYADLLRRTDTLAATLSYALLFFGVSTYVVFLPVWLEDTFHVTGAQVGTVFLAGGISNLIFAPWAGTISDKVGRRPLITLASLVTALFMASTTTFVDVFYLAYAWFFLVMIFVAMRIGPQQALVSSIVPAAQRGALLSLCFSVGQMGFGLGGLLAGPLYGTSTGFTANALVGSSATLTMGLLVWFGIAEPRGALAES